MVSSVRPVRGRGRRPDPPARIRSGRGPRLSRPTRRSARLSALHRGFLLLVTRRPRRVTARRPPTAAVRWCQARRRLRFADLRRRRAHRVPSDDGHCMRCVASGVPVRADAEGDLHRPPAHLVVGQRDGGQRRVEFRRDELLVVVADDREVARDLEAATVGGDVRAGGHAVVEAEDRRGAAAPRGGRAAAPRPRRPPAAEVSPRTCSAGSAAMPASARTSRYPSWRRPEAIGRPSSTSR